MRGHLYPLDVLRFFAACCVAAFHLSFYGWASAASTTSTMLQHATAYPELAPVTWVGWVGVEIFFVISGFVIAQSSRGRTPGEFMRSRVLRLYPAAWICATITLLALFAFAHQPVASEIGRYLHSMVLWVEGPWIDGVYWSLGVEIVFYLLVVGTLVFSRIVPLSLLPWLLTAVTLGYTLVLWTPLFDFFNTHNATRQILDHADTLMLRFGSFFALGIWLWMLSERMLKSVHVVGVALAVLCCIGEILMRARVMAQGELAISMALPGWEALVLWFGGVAFIVAAALRPHWFEVRSPAVQRVLVRVGLMTYPLFLVHNVLGAGLIRWGVTHGLNRWAALALALAAALTVAYVVSAFAEVAVRKWLRGIIDGGATALRGAPG